MNFKGNFDFRSVADSEEILKKLDHFAVVSQIENMSHISAADRIEAVEQIYPKGEGEDVDIRNKQESFLREGVTHAQFVEHFVNAKVLGSEDLDTAKWNVVKA